MAAHASADLLGLNFYPPSPRSLESKRARAICRQLRDSLGDRCPVLVGVFVNEESQRVAEICDKVGLDCAQLSGDETQETLLALRRRGVHAFKAIRPRNVDAAREEGQRLLVSGPADSHLPSLLLDAWHPTLYGGSGEQAGDELTRALVSEVPRLMLAGGPERGKRGRPRPRIATLGRGRGQRRGKRARRQGHPPGAGLHSGGKGRCMSELLDIFDERGQHLGVKERAAVHRDGDWHRVFHCWVVGRDDQGQARVLFQRRGAGKQTFPLFLAVTVGGHYRAGEATEDGLREMREELGVSLPFSALIPCGIRRIEARWNGLVDREFADTFMAIGDRPLTDYPVMQPEVEELVSVPVDAALALFAGEQDRIDARSSSGDCSIAMVDFVPNQANLFAEALRLARRILDSNRATVEQQEMQ